MIKLRLTNKCNELIRNVSYIRATSSSQTRAYDAKNFLNPAFQPNLPSRTIHSWVVKWFICRVTPNRVDGVIMRINAFIDEGWIEVYNV